MARTVGIEIQNFEKIIRNNYFYVDKTAFIKGKKREETSYGLSTITDWV